jgi:hypothetical protein
MRVADVGLDHAVKRLLHALKNTGFPFWTELCKTPSLQ